MLIYVIERAFLAFPLGAGMLNNTATGISNLNSLTAHRLIGAGAEIYHANWSGRSGEVVAYEGDLQAVQIGLDYRFGRHSKNTLYTSQAKSERTTAQ